MVSDAVEEKIKDRLDYVWQGVLEELQQKDMQIKQLSEYQNELHWQLAFKNDPSGETCVHCGDRNTWVDDCGWFYLHDTLTDIKGPTCKNCDEGNVGARHKERYGRGER